MATRLFLTGYAWLLKFTEDNDPERCVSSEGRHTFCLSRLLTSLMRIFAWSFACRTNNAESFPFWFTTVRVLI